MTTDNRATLRRMLRAAEEWGARRAHTTVTAATHTEPACCADGSLQTTVELRNAENVTAPTIVRCLVTLEPDGRLSCYEAESS